MPLYNKPNPPPVSLLRHWMEQLPTETREAQAGKIGLVYEQACDTALKMKKNNRLAIGAVVAQATVSLCALARATGLPKEAVLRLVQEMPWDDKAWGWEQPKRSELDVLDETVDGFLDELLELAEEQ